MKIQSVEFIKSSPCLSDCPQEPIPEVAFVGRSNVGKSSLLNSLVHRKKIAKVSATPGKTRLINFFKINHRFYFVDLPGYGFARISKAEQIKWKTMIETYLIHRPRLKGVIHLVDARVGLTSKDVAMKQWLEGHSKSFVVVATKMDRVPRGKRRGCLQEMADSLSLPVDSDIVPVSSKTGEGLPGLWKAIQQMLFPS